MITMYARYLLRQADRVSIMLSHAAQHSTKYYSTKVTEQSYILL